MARVHGEWHGCTEAGPPEVWNEEYLSRLMDSLDNIKATQGEAHMKEIFDKLPDSVKMDYIWSYWQYQAKTA